MTRRLVLSYLAITMIVLIILEIPLGIFYSQREEERLTADVERDAVVLASFYEDVLHFGFAPDPTPAEDYAARTGSRIVVVDTGGISVLDTEAAPARDFSTRPEVRTALTGVRSAGIRRSDTLDTDLLYVAVPVASGGTVHGALRLTIDAHEVAERVQRFWLGLVAIAVVVLLAVAGIGFAIARSVTRPLRELQATARRFSEGDLTPGEVTADAPPEVRSLGDAMNAMATRLDELIQAQRAFVSDASHQLRTPLTALRLRLENLETQLSTETDSAEVAAAIDEIQRLSDLVDGLLHLARAEEPPTSVIVDAAQTASDRVDTWTAVAAERDVTLRLESPSGPLPVSAVAGALEQILDNLLDNALNASPAGSTITVGIARSGGTTTVLVDDRGPGLDDESKVQALERFWKGDRSTPGTGLGLAIAQTLTQACGGRLDLRDKPGGGLSVVVELPSA
jgi:signal transduction histidine kinase